LAVRSRQIIFVNRFFHPDRSATSQILSDLAFYLAGQGERVRVITSRRLHYDPDLPPAARETLRGVEIHRVATSRFGRYSLPGRAVDYLSFHVTAGIALVTVARRGDIVVAKTDPPMLSVVTWLLAPFRRWRRVNWMQDLYPEVAAELGVSARGAVGRVLVAVRNASLRGAAVNVAIGDDMADRLRDAGLPSDTIRVIPNWTDDEAIVPADGASNALRKEWSLDGKFVVAYSGNLGRAHDVETLVGAAERLRARDDIVFLFIGGGSGLVLLKAEVAKRGLANFRFEPYQPREFLPRSLGVGDVHWLSLKAGLDGLILPSKFYGIAAAGRPIIVIGSPDGELSRLVTQYSCGVAIQPGQCAELARVISRLATDPSRARELGLSARRMLDEHFTKSQALARWHELLRAAG
jgi:glycosyltransferase involved in cell wall biosynthesis